MGRCTERGAGRGMGAGRGRGCRALCSRGRGSRSGERKELHVQLQYSKNHKYMTRKKASSLKFWNAGKKVSKKSYFFLNGPALYPHPLLMARPLIEEFFLPREVDTNTSFEANI